MHSVREQNKRLCTVMDLQTEILESLFAPVMFAELQNHSRLLTTAVRRTTVLVDKGHTVFVLINCKLKTSFITKCQLSYMECPLTRERKLKKNPTFHFRKCPPESVCLRECVNTEFDWEVKRGIENSVCK